MTAVFVAMCVTQALIAIAPAAHAPALAVYLLVAVSSLAATPYRSAHLAMVPLVARTPVELVAMNVTGGTLEGLATFAGPALAAVFLLRGEPWFVLAVTAVIAALGVVAVSRVRVGVDPSKALRRTPDRPLVVLIGGLTELRKNSDLAIVVGCCVVQLLVRGFLTVLLVSVSFDLLGLKSSGVGWLAAMLGIGGIVGGLGAVALTGRRRLGRPFALALSLWGLPIVLIGVHPTTAIVVVALFTIGVGNALLDVSGLTLIQRLGSDRSLGRVFGVLFTVGIALGGVGALTAPVLVSALGLRVVLVVVGAILPMLALVLTPRLRSLDDRSEPVPELLGCSATSPCSRRCHRPRSRRWPRVAPRASSPPAASSSPRATAAITSTRSFEDRSRSCGRDSSRRRWVPATTSARSRWCATSTAPCPSSP